MLLIDCEYKSELMVKASKAGIETVEEYEIWLMGYTSGCHDTYEDVKKDIKDGKM